MRRSLVLVSVTSALVVATLTACSGKPVAVDVARAAPAPTAPSTTKPSETLPANHPDSHGLLIKRLGQMAGYGGGPTLADSPVKFEIDSIVATTCKPGEYGEMAAPHYGQFLEVKGQVTTAPKASGQETSDASMFEFGAIGPDNYKVPDANTIETSSCLENSTYWPREIQTGTNYRFDFLLDVPDGHGIVTLGSQQGFANGGSGWGWKY